MPISVIIILCLHPCIPKVGSMVRNWTKMVKMKNVLTQAFVYEIYIKVSKLNDWFIISKIKIWF